MSYKRCKVIAEIGCNHKGEMDIAKDLISLAKQSGADVAKFQKEILKNCYLNHSMMHHIPIQLTLMEKLMEHIGNF